MKRNIVGTFVYLVLVVLLMSCAGKLPSTILGDGTPQTQTGNTVEPVAGNTAIPAGLSEAPPPLAGNPNPAPAASAPSGTEETPVTTAPAVITLGNNTMPRLVRIKVSDANMMTSIYTTLIVAPSDDRRLIKFSKPTKSVALKDVKPGVYYLNVESTTRRWAVENEPKVDDPHRPLTFNVYIQVNDGPWTQFGSADTEKVAGQWWNIKVTIP